MTELDWSPAEVNITVTVGDTTEEWSCELLRDGVPFEAAIVVAQVRRRRDRSSELLMDLTPSVAGNVVTFPPVEVDAPVGASWRWDLQADGLTVLGGTYAILADVSHVPPVVTP